VDDVKFSHSAQFLAGAQSSSGGYVDHHVQLSAAPAGTAWITDAVGGGGAAAGHGPLGVVYGGPDAATSSFCHCCSPLMDDQGQRRDC